MSHIPYYGEDVMDQPNTISIEELMELSADDLSAAGIDELTPVDTFIEMNGERAYVTDLYPR